MPAIALLVLTIAAIIVLIIYVFYTIFKKMRDRKMNNPHKILKYLYETAKKRGNTAPENFTYKTEILEAIHINIKDLKSCVTQLKKEGLISDVDECLALTQEGINYYELFIGVRRPKWAK